MYPLLFQFGSITLPTYGACLAIGLVAGLFLSLRNVRQLQIPADSMWNLSMLIVLSALVGSKLLLIFSNLRDFFRYPLLMLSLSITQSHRTWLGALALAIFVGFLYLRAKKMPLLRTLDAAAPALLLGDALVNLGAFAAGSAYGTRTTLPWGVIYSSRWAAFWSGTPLGVRLHPTQLYLCAIELILCALLLWLLPRQRQAGEGIGAGLFLYGLALFGVDFLRGDQSYILFHGSLSVSQAVAILLLLIGALLWLERTPASPNDAPPPHPPKRPQLHLITRDRPQNRQENNVR